MIIKTRGGNAEVRQSIDAMLLAAGLSPRSGWGSTAGVPVTTSTVAGIPAFEKAVRFASEAIAIFDPEVWQRDSLFPTKVKSTWQARLFRGAPNSSFQSNWFTFWETIERSLEYRWIAYYWKSFDASGRVAELYALHPDQVRAQLDTRTKRIVFTVTFGPGYPTPPEVKAYDTVVVDSSTVWAIRGPGGIGEFMPPTPIEQFRRSLGIAIARDERESTVMQNGIHGGFVVRFPQGVTEAQAKTWKKLFGQENAGLPNSAAVRVVGAGAEVEQIGMTQRDAQFVESYGLAMNDISNITNVPVSFLSPPTKGANQLPEHDEARWVNHGLRQRLRRIEAAVNADPNLFGPGSRHRFGFDTSELIHPDAATEDNIWHQRVQDGRVLVDEWRVPRGFDALPDGLGMIPQIIPVGGTSEGVPVPKAPKSDDE